MTKKVFWIFFLTLFATIGFSSEKKPVAEASVTQGRAWILRPPGKIPQPSLPVVNKFGTFFHRLPVQSGTPLYFGDVIETEFDSRVSMTSSNWGEIYLSPNSSLLIAPDFVTMFRKQGIIPVMHLLLGKVRFRSNAGIGEQPLTSSFRAGKIKTNISDYVVVEEAGLSAVYGIRGDFSVVAYSPEERIATARVIQLYLRRQYKQLVEIVKRLDLVKEHSVSTFSEGTRIRQLYTSSPLEARVLQDNLGDLAEAYLYRKINESSGPITEQDISFILSTFDHPSEVAHLIAKIKLESEEELEEEEEEAEEVAPEPQEIIIREAPPKKEPSNFTLRIGAEGHENTYNDRYKTSSVVLNFDVIWRPLSFFYSSIGVSRGQVEVSGMADYLGSGEPESLNRDFNRLHALAGFYGIFWETLGLHLGFGVVDNQEVLIQYEDSFVNVNRTYTLLNDPLPWTELGISLHFFERTEVYLNYGIAEASANIAGNEIKGRYGSNLNAVGIKLGMGFGL